MGDGDVKNVAKGGGRGEVEEREMWVIWAVGQERQGGAWERTRERERNRGKWL